MRLSYMGKQKKQQIELDLYGVCVGEIDYVWDVISHF